MKFLQQLCIGRDSTLTSLLCVGIGVESANLICTWLGNIWQISKPSEFDIQRQLHFVAAPTKLLKYCQAGAEAACTLECLGLHAQPRCLTEGVLRHA